MASWIVHLRIAELLLARIPALVEPYFTVGNIAPDSGIPDEKWEKFDPPPEVTHFKRATATRYSQCDLDFYHAYLAPFRRNGLDRKALSLRWGYFFHLATDNLWMREIVWPTQSRFAEQFAADPGFIWEVKNDWYGLDQRYVRLHPDSLFWRVFLKCGEEEAGLDFLPAAALRQRIAYIQAFYQEDSPAIQALLARPFVYLSEAEMDGFTGRAADSLERAFTRLWLEGRDAAGLATVLEMEGI